MKRPIFVVILLSLTSTAHAAGLKGLFANLFAKTAPASRPLDPHAVTLVDTILRSWRPPPLIEHFRELTLRVLNNSPDKKEDPILAPLFGEVGVLSLDLEDVVLERFRENASNQEIQKKLLLLALLTPDPSNVIYPHTPPTTVMLRTMLSTSTFVEIRRAAAAYLLAYDDLNANFSDHSHGFKLDRKGVTIYHAQLAREPDDEVRFMVQRLLNREGRQGALKNCVSALRDLGMK